MYLFFYNRSLTQYTPKSSVVFSLSLATQKYFSFCVEAFNFYTHPVLLYAGAEALSVTIR